MVVFETVHSFADGPLAEAAAAHTLWLLAALLVMTVAVRALAREDRPRLRVATVLVGLHLALLPLLTWTHAHAPIAYRDVQLVSLIIATFALVGLAGILMFGIVLPRVHVRAPRILRDVLSAAAALVAVFALAARAGHPLSGIIATSAVVTAVIGLSLQDTLGNIMAGLALQMDQSIVVGDWVKVGDVVGIVRDIR